MKFSKRTKPEFRTVVKFAIIPKLIDDTYIWLEWYKEDQQLEYACTPEMPKTYYITLKRYQ